MYSELVEKFVAEGANVELVEKLFAQKKYDRPGFAEYVYNKLLKTRPVDVDAWLKLSLRFCLKVFVNAGKAPVVAARKKANKKRSETLIKKHKETKDDDLSIELKQKFDSLSSEEKEKYNDRVKEIDINTPDFLINFKAFSIFCEDIEKEKKENESE